MGTAAEFQEWVMKTLNNWGRDGWLAISVQTPAAQQGFTGDLFVLAVREMPGKDVENNKVGYIGEERPDSPSTWGKPE
jgi:hypothetical protein